VMDIQLHLSTYKNLWVSIKEDKKYDVR
jgi:hypothetical protein